MGTISKALLFVPLDLTSVPERMSNDWRQSTKDKADSGNQKRWEVIRNEMDYKTKMAGPSSEAYSPFPSSTFRSRSGKTRDEIVKAQAKHALDTFSKYEQKLIRLFEEVEGEVAKRYKDSVDNAVDNYSTRTAKWCLPFTGEKTIGKSITGIAPLWLTDDPTTERHIRGADQILAGGPVNVAKTTPVDTRSALKAALAQQLTRSGVIIIEGDFQPSVMLKENDALNSIINGLQDSVTYVPFATGGASHCDYVLIDGKMFLEIQVSVP